VRDEAAQQGDEAGEAWSTSELRSLSPVLDGRLQAQWIGDQAPFVRPDNSKWSIGDLRSVVLLDLQGRLSY